MDENIESLVGTYLRIVRFPGHFDPDAFTLLYLRPTGFFLLLGYWHGYEYTKVAGRW